DQSIGLRFPKRQEETVIPNVDGRELQRLQSRQALVSNGYRSASVEKPQHAVAKSNLRSGHPEHFRRQCRRSASWESPSRVAVKGNLGLAYTREAKKDANECGYDGRLDFEAHGHL